MKGRKIFKKDEYSHLGYFREFADIWENNCEVKKTFSTKDFIRKKYKFNI